MTITCYVLCSSRNSPVRATIDLTALDLMIFYSLSLTGVFEGRLSQSQMIVWHLFVVRGIGIIVFSRYTKVSASSTEIPISPWSTPTPLVMDKGVW